jgi:sphinganine-1-phosphate aldolase
MNISRWYGVINLISVAQSHQAFLNEAFGIYSLANPLHADIWPSGMKYESEIVAMTANLVNGGDPNVVGCTTSVS